jgi:hypothetical protein
VACKRSALENSHTRCPSIFEIAHRSRLFLPIPEFSVHDISRTKLFCAQSRATEEFLSFVRNYIDEAKSTATSFLTKCSSLSSAAIAAGHGLCPDALQSALLLCVIFLARRFPFSIRRRQFIRITRKRNVQGRQQVNTQHQRRKQPAYNHDRKWSLRIRPDSARQRCG